MSHYQEIVVEYLRADRSIFMNHEFTIQLEEGTARSQKGASWISDVVAVDFRNNSVFLCEDSYSQTLSALIKRLKSWSDNWPSIVRALRRDSCVPDDFMVRPWVFIPASLIGLFVKKFRDCHAEFEKKAPLITPLEMTVPWEHSTWNRCGEKSKSPYPIPLDMQT